MEEEKIELNEETDWMVPATVKQMLEEEIRETLEQLATTDAVKDNAVSAKMLLDRLKLLQDQQLAIQKQEAEREIKALELKLQQQKFEVETAIRNRELELTKEKAENETALKNRELELKKEAEEKANKLEEARLKEQKRANVTTAVVGGVTAATGLAGLWASLHMFKKGLTFEQTGSYTTKTSQQIGNLFSILRRR